MIECATYADGDVYRGGDGAAADAHLQLLGQPSSVNHVAGGGDRCAEGAGSLHQGRHIFFLYAHSKPDDHASSSQVAPLGVFLKLLAEEPHVGAVEGFGGKVFDHRLSTGFRDRWCQEAGPQSYQVGQSFRQYWRNHVAAQGRFQLHQLTFFVYFQIDGVAGQSETQPGRQPGREVAPVGGGCEEDGIGRFALHGGGESIAHGAAGYRPQRGVVQHQNAVGSSSG